MFSFTNTSFLISKIMPSKKGVQVQGTDKENKGNQRPPSPLLKDGADPFEVVVSMMDKRARNLTKRKVRNRR